MMNTKEISEFIKQKIEKHQKVVLEFGPGIQKTVPDAIGLDICGKESVDCIVNLNLGLNFIEDNSVDVIYSNHFLEHIDNIEFLMQEIYRILKPGGQKIGTVPHFSNPYFFSDYTHKNFWGLYTLCYFSNQDFFHRKVPNYYNTVDFKINHIAINFSSPFKYRNYFKKLIERIVNYNTWSQEFYEENLTYIFPAYELSFTLEKQYA